MLCPTCSHNSKTLRRTLLHCLDPTSRPKKNLSPLNKRLRRSSSPPAPSSARISWSQIKNNREMTKSSIRQPWGYRTLSSRFGLLQRCSVIYFQTTTCMGPRSPACLTTWILGDKKQAKRKNKKKSILHKILTSPSSVRDMNASSRGAVNASPISASSSSPSPSPPPSIAAEPLEAAAAAASLSAREI